MTDSSPAGYPPLLLQHHRSPCGRTPVASPTHTAVGDNPLCGDRLRLCLRLSNDRLAEIECDAVGCAISRASASILAELLAGRLRSEALALTAVLIEALHVSPNASPPALPESLAVPSVEALLSVRRYPVRTRCATLCWEALQGALAPVPG